MSERLASETFEQQLQTCLTHFYDYAFLQNDALVAEIAPGEDGADRVQKFRERITRAIEKIRPASNIDFHARSVRPYNVLTLRYIDQLETEEILHQLALSRRQFWREQAKALHILANILRNELPKAAFSDAPQGRLSPELSLESEVASLGQYEADREQVNLYELLVSILNSTQSLAEQHRVRLEVTEFAEKVQFHTDWTLLRQSILVLLSRLIVQTPPDSVLTLSCAVDDAALQLRLVVQSQQNFSLQLEPQETLSFLLKKLDAQLDQPDSRQFLLSIPLRQQMVLVIDDNPDVINLFRRYLADQPYRLVAAHSGKQALEAAREGDVDVIILDIMLPKQDGFEILQNLKTHPLTQHIPVLVCSILEVSDLVFSLGANGYLRKPPGQAEFLKFLSQWWG